MIFTKTKNVGYVDVEELNLGNLFAPLKVRMVEKVKIEKQEQYVRSNLTVLPAIALSDVSKPTKEDGHDGVVGRFVDLSSIIPYQKFQKDSSKVKLKSR